MNFQPSEMVKITVPLVVAYYLAEHPLPPRLVPIALSGILVVVPTVLIAKQPDLGTSLLIAASGVFVLFLSGMSWRVITVLGAAGAACAPILWYSMHDYQRQRVLTFLDPEVDPLGSGYHIIQSKIAIGSGGTYGKGWLNGTQSQLEFLPERSTDFVFAVLSEEFGLMGVLVLLTVYMLVVLRGLHIAQHAQDAFGAHGRRKHYPDVLRLRVRQHRHGQWPAPGRRAAPAAHQLWRDVTGDRDGRDGHPDVVAHAPAPALLTRNRDMSVTPRGATWTARARMMASCAMLAGAMAGPATAQPFDYEKDFSQFAAEVAARRGLDLARVRSLLEQATYSKRVVDAMNRPAERKPWYKYRPIFLTKVRIDGGVAFWKQHARTLERARGTYGVPPEIVVAIIGVETLYGTRKGKIRVLDSRRDARISFSAPGRFLSPGTGGVSRPRRRGGARRRFRSGVVRRRHGCSAVHLEQLSRLCRGLRRRWPARPHGQPGGCDR